MKPAFLIADEFCPDSERSTDDEETIAQAEATNKEEESDEVAALQRESEMDFESFLNELPKDYLQNRDKIRLSEGEHSVRFKFGIVIDCR